MAIDCSGHRYRTLRAIQSLGAIMIGRVIKSGAQLKAERAIIDGTNKDGFLPRSAVDHVLNKEVLRNTLTRWGYLPEYSGTMRQRGWTCTSRP